jgi:protein-S-isoprenylcysteine O-methyltransferase Ste14
MNTQEFVLGFWIIFVVYWFISSSSVKPVERTSGWLGGNWYTLLFLLGFGFMIGFRPLARLGIPLGTLAFSLIPHTVIIALLAVILLATGLVIAIAGRRMLSGNWSSQVAIKEGHELITTGLYGYIRNPIYAGILLMTLGTALSIGTLGAGIGFLVVVLGLYLKLSDEEHILARHFGETYTSYKEHTRALIPFLW